MERVNTKWVAAAASIWIQSFSGATYTFAIYSSILKSSQSYDQSTLDFVSVFKDIGGTLGIFSGYLYTAMTSKPHGRGGPWVVVFAGLVQWFLGFFFMWASVVGLIAPPPVALMCLFVFLSGHSLPFFNTASVVTAARNFPDYGGTAVGIMQGFLGLSGAILIQLYHALSGGEGNPATFILLLAIVPTLVIFFTMPFVRVYESVTTSNKKHLDGLSVISLIIAAYLMVIIMVQNVLGLPRSMQIFSFVLVIVLLASPILVAVRASREEKQSLSTLDYPVLDTSALLDFPSPDIFPDGDLVVTEDSNILEAMSTVNFWLLFLAMLCGMGSGFATINNIRQIGESLRYSTVQLNSLVSLWSIWNFLGRFGAGYISDTFLHKRTWPRPVFMVITLGIMAIGHIVVASGLVGSLYVGSVLIGMAYGSQWSLMPTITSEIFGIRHMGTIYFTISIAGPIGSYLLSVKVIGYFYDKVASEVDNSCFGSKCFRTSFMIMASVALFGSLVASVLLFRTNKFYKMLVAKRSLK
ncbi:unnamed protein product [Thlaspi arvense]|uniref:Major facilitator superfamily (MFS) profile domain-containing protein n=1 Tax=Thlaspi arvense TaxID=13288 RepID=A0AAU9S6Q5_THLAR|nr:unnamed protein product [Thlaspi arvense]